MKRLVTLSSVLCVIWISCYAQQDPSSSLYMYKTEIYNPGAIGVDGLFNITASSRKQWVGFEGAPFTASFTASAPITIAHTKHGVGLTVESDDIGFDSNISFSGSYAYLWDMGLGTLGIGVNLGMINTNLDPKWFIPGGSAFTPAEQDPLIPTNNESFVAFDAGLGIYLSNENYYVGLSVKHLNKPKIKYSEATPYFSRHYYLTGGYIFQLSNPSFEIIPSAQGLLCDGIMQLTTTALVRYNKKLWGGLSYRTSDALIGSVGLELYNGIKICYAYDFPLSKIRTATSGSHEIVVNYSFDFSLGKSTMQYKSIRLL